VAIALKMVGLGPSLSGYCGDLRKETIQRVCAHDLADAFSPQTACHIRHAALLLAEPYRRCGSRNADPRDLGASRRGGTIETRRATQHRERTKPKIRAIAADVNLR
jgi:hypothetical protein